MKGVVRTGAVVTIGAAATSTTLFTVSTGRTVDVATLAAATVVYIVRRLWLYYLGTAAVAVITLGETVAAAWTPRLPSIDLPRNTLLVLGEGTPIPIAAVKFTSSLIGRTDTVLGGGVEVIVEVLEYPDFLEVA